MLLKGINEDLLNNNISMHTFKFPADRRWIKMYLFFKQSFNDMARTHSLPCYKQLSSL